MYKAQNIYKMVKFNTKILNKCYILLLWDFNNFRKGW
jgi:hypothetical protein